MQYSDPPHESYLKGDWGPGSAYVGDLERWNWRYLMIGTEVDGPFDAGLMLFFNDSQRRLMQLPPVEALEHIATFLPNDVTEAARQRASEAQERLFPQKIVSREDNVIFGNFGKRK